MFLNSMRRRLGMVAVGIILSGALFFGGGFASKKNSNIQIEFGMDANAFLGLEVEIDGQVAGTLKMFGNATRTGFLVEPGMHEVAVIHPTLDCIIRTVEANPGDPVMLILTYHESVNENGEVVTMLGWEN